MKKNINYKLLSILSLIMFVFIWWLITDGLGLVNIKLMPGPFTVIKAFIGKFISPSPDGSILITHILSSLRIVILGFLVGSIIGLPIGIALAWNRKAEMLIKPLFDFIRTIPPVGWIPIMIIILGIGLKANVAMISIASFIPVAINTYSGIKQTNQIHLWVGQTFGATNTQLLRRVAIPSALPFIFSGLKISFNVSWMTVVAAELLAANKGLGYMIQVARTIGRPDIILVGMLTLAGVGYLLYSGLEYIEAKFVKGETK